MRANYQFLTKFSKPTLRLTMTLGPKSGFSSARKTTTYLLVLLCTAPAGVNHLSMLQRIQSLFLLLALLVNVAIILVPAWQFTQGKDLESITALGVAADFAEPATDQSRMFFEHTDSTKQIVHIAFFALLSLATIGLVVVILGFNDRMRQKRLAYAAILLIMLEIGALIGLSTLGPVFVQGNNASPALGFALPIVSIILIWLAIRRIQKDEDLVKSIDRIR